VPAPMRGQWSMSGGYELLAPAAAPLVNGPLGSPNPGKLHVELLEAPHPPHSPPRIRSRTPDVAPSFASMATLHRNACAEAFPSPTAARPCSRHSSEVQLGITGGHPMRPTAAGNTRHSLVLATAGAKGAWQVSRDSAPSSLKMQN
jgi:hypothetical protein